MVAKKLGFFCFAFFLVAALKANILWQTINESHFAISTVELKKNRTKFLLNKLTKTIFNLFHDSLGDKKKIAKTRYQSFKTLEISNTLELLKRSNF